MSTIFQEKLKNLTMVLILVPEITPRLQYVCSFIFDQVIRIPFKLTTDQKEFSDSNLPKIVYGKSPEKNSLFLCNNHLLFESNIDKQDIEFKLWDKTPIFFSVEQGDLPFDFFSATFYLISRYEEYIAKGRDRHNRFKSEDSISFKGGFLDRPIINIWTEKFKSILLNKFPSLSFPEPHYSFTPTVDIDNAYAYKYKGVWRATMGLMEKLVQFKFKKLAERISVHTGKERDPYDTYEKLDRIHRTYKLRPLFFFLLGDYGKFDRNISHQNKHLIHLIQALDKNAEVGIHPSYKSNENFNQLQKEKSRLENILNRKISISRQHYIKLELPTTYRNLIALGIKDDYSMGFPSKIGFRAGTGTPFYFFDLEKNISTDLKIHPFVMMDSTLKYYLRFRSREVIPYMEPIVEELKRVGGEFVFVFHNESLGETKMWKNWGDIYEKVIRLARKES